MARQWNWKRQLAGNVLPMVLCGIPAVVGLWLAIRTNNPFGAGLWWVAASPVVGWISANYLGLLGNHSLRETLTLALRPPKAALFVGFAQPNYTSLLDPHQDVGFLWHLEDKLVFRGESMEVAIPKEGIKVVRFRPNPHSWLLLGRWISVEGDLPSGPFQLLVEPRERATLRGNRALSSIVRKQITTWAGLPDPGAAPTTEGSRSGGAT